MSRFVCQALAKHHDRRSFRCGVAELDDYLQDRASQDIRRHTAAVFVLVPEDQPQRIAGFYSLSSASIVLQELPAEFIKELPRYPMVPAVLPGHRIRLAANVSADEDGGQAAGIRKLIASVAEMATLGWLG